MPYLQDYCRLARASILEMFHAGEVAGFSVPIIAAQIPLCIEPQVLYGAAFLVMASGASVTLILGTHYTWLQWTSPVVLVAVVQAEIQGCGIRLGSTCESVSIARRASVAGDL